MDVRKVVLVLGLLAVLSTAGGGYLYFHSVRESALKETEKEFVQTIEALKDDAVRLVSFNQDEVKALAGFEQFQESLADPQNKDALLRADRVLDHFAEGLKYDVCFLIDSSGNCIGSSNRNTPDSFIGVNYLFRKYFQDAIQGRPSVELALGRVTGIRGIFFSHPVFSSDGAKPIGVVVIKVSTQGLDRVFSKTRNMIAMLVNSDGMIFVSSRDNWILNLLWKLPPLELARIRETGQFGKGPWNWTGLEKNADNQVLDDSGADYTIREMNLENGPGWKIVSLYSSQMLSEKIFNPWIGRAGPIALILFIVVGSAVVVLFTLAQRDLRGREKSEGALRTSEEKFRRMFERHSAIMLLVEPLAGKIVDANQSAERFYGYNKSQLHSMSIQDINILSPDEVEHEFNLAIQERRNYFVFPHRLASGEVRTVEVHSSPIEQSGEKILFSIINDITDRKRAEKLLSVSSAYNRTLIETSPDALMTISDEGKITDVNTATEQFTGCSREELIGTDFSDYFTDPEKARTGYRQVFRDGSVKDYELELRHKNGQAISVLCNASVYRDEAGKIAGSFAAARDITNLKEVERKLQDLNQTLEERVAERSRELVAANRQLLSEIQEHARTTSSLRDSEKRMRMVIESSPIGIFMIRDGKYTFVNQAFMKIFGLTDKSDVIRKAPETPFGDASGRQFSVILEQCLGRSETINVNEFKVFTGDQRQRHLDIWLQPLELSESSVVMGFIIDASEELELRTQLNQAQKMEALGSLAGGIAHDFNNVLFAITGYTELALSSVPSGSPENRHLEQVISAAQRAADLVKHILTFSRETKQENKPLLIGPILKESLSFLRASISQNVEIRRNISANLHTVNGDPTQIHQIIMNLVTNAYHAMKNTGGALDVGLEEVNLDSDFVKTRPGLVPGTYQKLTVSDTGHGMTQETLKRIFDPYFTTKEVGQGTGLGLIVVDGIIREYGGNITVTSAPEQGTTFEVYLPIIMDQEISSEEAERVAPVGVGRILFVDDETMVTYATKANLESLGYTVLTENDPVRAFAQFEAEPYSFDLIITDMSMPKMTGLQLSMKISQIRSDIPIILITGFSDILEETKLSQYGIRELVHKPIRKASLAQAISNILRSVSIFI